MRQSRSAPAARTDPRPLLSEIAGTIMLAVATQSSLGVLVPLATIGALGLLVLLNRHLAFKWRQVWPFMLFPLVPLLSTLWSPGPFITLRYALLLLILFIAVMQLVIAVPLATFVRILFVSQAIACAMAIASGIKGPSTEGLVVVGLLGSKNAMSASASLLLVTGITILLDRRQPGPVRIAALPMVPLSIYLVMQAHAATHIILDAVGAGLALSFVVLAALPRRGRIGVVLGCALVLAPLGIMRDTISQEVTNYVFTTFDKEPTLTGRTYLWQVADEQIAQRPVLGWGYKYIWLSGSSAAEGMLRSQNVRDPRTFSMHQTWLETRADLGIIGVLALALTFAGAIGLTAWRAAMGGSASEILAACYVVMLLIRSFTDMLIGPMYPPGTLTAAFGAYALMAVLRERRLARAAAEPPRARRLAARPA